MARDILKGKSHLPKRDLESFFWLLAWIVLPHADHGGSLDGLVDVFDILKATAASTQKFGWLFEVTSGVQEIGIRKNEPLTQLLRQFAHLLTSEFSGVDHDTVLRIFEVALKGKWPRGDRCITRTSKKRKCPPYSHSG